jgi:hypothetical protein
VVLASRSSSLFLTFVLVAEFDGVAVVSVSVPSESDVAEYGRNLDRLDKVLGSIEQYIHIAYASMKKDDVIRRVYHMVSCSSSYEVHD